jgi:hypothetical protein
MKMIYFSWGYWARGKFRKWRFGVNERFAKTNLDVR